MPLQREVSRNDGDSVDLYYNQKERFVRGYTRAAKQTRSVKGKRQIEYQVDKRRQQSMRDKAMFSASMYGECSDYDGM